MKVLLTSFFPDLFRDVARDRPVQELPVNFWKDTNIQRGNQRSINGIVHKTVKYVTFWLFLCSKGLFETSALKLTYYQPVYTYLM